MDAKVGERWSCIRMTREIQANEELLVSNYGAEFWQRYERESDWERWEDSELYRPSFFKPLIQVLKKRRRQTEAKVRTASSRTHRRVGGMQRPACVISKRAVLVWTNQREMPELVRPICGESRHSGKLCRVIEYFQRQYQELILYL